SGDDPVAFAVGAANGADVDPARETRVVRHEAAEGRAVELEDPNVRTAAGPGSGDDLVHAVPVDVTHGHPDAAGEAGGVGVEPAARPCAGDHGRPTRDRPGGDTHPSREALREGVEPADVHTVGFEDLHRGPPAAVGAGDDVVGAAAVEGLAPGHEDPAAEAVRE